MAVPAEPFDLVEYEDVTGKAPFPAWLRELDGTTQARITIGLRRLETGNTSSVKSVGDGVFELRMDFGPGYRVYFGRVGLKIVLLLMGGSKHRQSTDIAKAKAYWLDFQKRTRSKENARPSIQRNRAGTDSGKR